MHGLPSLGEGQLGQFAPFPEALFGRGENAIKEHKITLFKLFWRGGIPKGNIAPGPLWAALKMCTLESMRYVLMLIIHEGSNMLCFVMSVLGSCPVQRHQTLESGEGR